MSKSLPKLLALFFLMASCDLLDGVSNFEELGFTTFPSARNQFIAQNDNLSLTFDEPVETASLEGLISVGGWRSPPNGVWVYTPTSAVFYPSDPWEPGIRYTLSAKGTVTGSDQRKHSLDLYIPFFMDNRQAPLQVVSYTPLSGESLDVTDALTFQFNLPVDIAQFEDFFRISPLTEGTYTWNEGVVGVEDHTQLTFTPEDPFEALRLHSWTIDKDLPSSYGTKLWESQRGYFLTQNDVAFPEVQSVERRTLLGDTFMVPPDTALNAVENGDGIFVIFSKDMDWSQGISGITFSPVIPGEWLIHSTDTLAFKPTETWKDVDYTIKVPNKFEDPNGLKMLENSTETFRPNIEYQTLSLILPSQNPVTPIVWPAEDSALVLAQTLDRDNLVNTPFTAKIILSFDFDDPYAALDEFGDALNPQPLSYLGREEIRNAVKLEKLFPSYAHSPQLVSFTWSADFRQLNMVFEDLTYSIVGEDVYYKLTVGATATNVLSGNGTAFEKELTLILELPHDTN